MPRLIDLTGQRFGRLIVVERAEDRFTPKGLRQACWLCVCDCGAEKIVYGERLRKGWVVSCGCYQREKTVERNRAREASELTYKGMHLRVKRHRGRASQNPCVDCGASAADWSCRHDAGHTVDDAGRYYSLNVEDYDPRCKACHARYDSRNTV